MANNEVLYHSSIVLPKGFVAPTQRVEIAYGSHSRQEAMRDRYGIISLPKMITLSRMKVIEVGVIDGKVSKILFRGRLDDERDLCIVLIPNGNRPWFAKTCWVNVNSDQHRTLDASRYVAA